VSNAIYLIKNNQYDYSRDTTHVRLLIFLLKMLIMQDFFVNFATLIFNFESLMRSLGSAYCRIFD